MKNKGAKPEIKKFAVFRKDLIEKDQFTIVGHYRIATAQEFEYKQEKAGTFKLKIKGRYYDADPKDFDFIEATETQEQRNERVRDAAPELLEEITASCIIMQGLVRNLMDGVYKTPSELLPRLESLIASQIETIKKADPSFEG